ncbi:RelA/SpoT domain-containing protein [Natronosporangium hydrolyticum]|uniref:RelA/SpoT domain-containing protein n=1 Tax=Natronosporangium hydrolyticum TaxID=2811111 RepID=A0A895Y9Z2_9ACTN|nr:RelA/SpoT domain-containing protein [Natronosporangium hydrolyticum]QSB14171.1 RelA/SpoT domain-containing protein [Natronosporangium hydrolyticum]
MGFIEDFVDRYTKEYDFYAQAARLGAQELESALHAAGIRCIVTSRAKSIPRLREKCRQRERQNGGYASVAHIVEDIVDLAGVRVALYFPAEREQVHSAIHKLFHVHLKKEFPELGKLRPDKRFTGYSAAHYRVQLREQELGDSEKRYATARIEIQVASVLMHAWAEVEHDLAYKPLTEYLSDAESAILDQLNGLVIAGEIALEQLQKAGEGRVATSGRIFANHFELAAHLIGRMEAKTQEPISEAGLGRVDFLFDFITDLGLNTPEHLAPHLDSLHGNVELRPLAEQIVDVLLAEDAARYRVYNSLHIDRVAVESGTAEEESAALGIFMARWIELEKLIRELAVAKGAERPLLQAGRQLKDLGVIPPELIVEFDQLRRLRNQVIHAVERPGADYLVQVSRRVDTIIGEIQRRISESDDKE